MSALVGFLTEASPLTFLGAATDCAAIDFRYQETYG